MTKNNRSGPTHNPPGNSSRKAKKKPNYYYIGSLEKGINILRILSKGGPMSLPEIAAEAQLDRSGCHRYLLTFRDLHLLTKDPRSGYKLTPALFQIAMAHINRLGVRQIVRPFMEEMSLKFNETVNLVVQEGDHVVFLDKVQGGHQSESSSYRAEISIGTRHPVYCTAQGKAIIAFRPENERVAFCENMNDLKAFSANTITSSDAFKKEMSLIRRRGFAINNEEYFAGLNGVAAPIIDYTGFPIYSISVAGPSSRLPPKTMLEIGEYLKKVCTRISGILGQTE